MEMNNAVSTDTSSGEDHSTNTTETITETPAAKTYMVVVDGVEVEVDEDTLRKGYTHGAAANKRMSDASNMRKEAEEVIKFFKSNPREAFAKLGLDAKQFAEQLIYDDLNESLMDPKDRELRDYKKKVDSYESTRRKQDEESANAQMEAEIAAQSEAIQTEIIDTLTSAGLPQTERTVGRIAYYMQSALHAGFDVTPKDVIEQVRQDYVHDFKQFMGGMTESQIEMFLGNDMVKKMAKTTVKQAKGFESPVSRSVNANISKSPKAKDVRSPRDFFKPKR